MPIAPPQIESYLYSDLPSLRTIRVREGVPWFTFTLPGDMTVSDALTYWAGAATAEAGLAGVYVFSWASSQQVILACSVPCEIDLQGSLPAALGFSVAVLTGAAIYRSDLTPRAIANPVNVDYEPPWAAEETDTRRYRWGRVSSRVHYRTYLTRISVLMRSTQADDLLDGPLFVSRLIAYPCGYVAGLYSAANLSGALDVYPYELIETQRLGSSDSDTIVSLVGSVSP